jgi:hypothetical protein
MKKVGSDEDEVVLRMIAEEQELRESQPREKISLEDVVSMAEQMNVRALNVDEQLEFQEKMNTATKQLKELELQEKMKQFNQDNTKALQHDEDISEQIEVQEKINVATKAYLKESVSAPHSPPPFPPPQIPLSRETQFVAYATPMLPHADPLAGVMKGT